MNEYEKNVYTNLFEYPTKHIVKLELENEEKDKEIDRLNNKIKEQNLLLIEFQDMEQKVDIYKSRFKKANEWIHKYQQTIENMRKEKFYILNLGVDDLKEFKNIINGSDDK